MKTFRFKKNPLYIQASEAEAEIAALRKANGEMDSMYQDRLLDMEAKVNTATERERVLREALPPAERLETLADWFDKCYYHPSCSGDTEVQDDLRKWSANIRAALAQVK